MFKDTKSFVCVNLGVRVCSSEYIRIKYINNGQIENDSLLVVCVVDKSSILVSEDCVR